jgi:hypothetical protein
MVLLEMELRLDRPDFLPKVVLLLWLSANFREQLKVPGVLSFQQSADLTLPASGGDRPFRHC